MASQSDSGGRQVEITGVLMDPESLSCKVWVNRDTTFEQIIVVLNERLTATYNDAVRPDSPIVLEELDFLIGLYFIRQYTRALPYHRLV